MTREPAIEIDFDEHFNSLFPAQHDHDLLESKLKLILGQNVTTDSDKSDYVFWEKTARVCGAATGW